MVRGDLKQIFPSTTYSSVATAESIKLMLVKIVNQNLQVRQADDNTAFLYGREQEEVHLDLSDGHPQAQDGAWKSIASVYGL